MNNTGIAIKPGIEEQRDEDEAHAGTNTNETYLELTTLQEDFENNHMRYNGLNSQTVQVNV